MRNLCAAIGFVVVTFGLAACGDDGDASPPEVIAIAPADGATGVWLHEPIRVTFNEALHTESITGANLYGQGGTLIAATVTATAENELTIVADDDTALVGELRLVLGAGITDRAGNPLTETSVTWMLSPWSHAQTPGETPSIAIDDAGTILMARGTQMAPHRVLVSRWSGSGWVDLGDPLGASDAALPAVTFDTDGNPFVVWSQYPLPGGPVASPTVEAARWNGTAWDPIASLDGAYATVARPPTGAPLIAYTTASAASNGAVVRVRKLDGDRWQPLEPNYDVLVNGAVAGLPQLAVPAPAMPVLTFADTGGGLTPPQVRIVRWTGTWSEVSPITLGPAPNNGLNRVTIAAHDSKIVVGYDTFEGSFGVHAVVVTGSTWQPLGGQLDVDPSGNAQAPSIALDADDNPIIAWREHIDGNWRGVLARWNGSAWITVGGHVWNTEPSRPSIRPALVLLRDRVPVVAWSEVQTDAVATTLVGMARFNGPSEPPIGGARASIVGCAFDESITTLSATGCFTIANGRATPHAGLIPFDLSSELWSDGALKRRWIALPDGEMLTTPSTGAWDAPPGSMMVKEFAIETTPGDSQTRRVMETRFLIKRASGITAWNGFSFRWRSDGSDADLLPDAAITVAWPLAGGATHTHSYPSRAQCTRCHDPSNGPLLGLRSAQLARRADYDGIISDQIEAFAQMGVIAPQAPVPAFASPHDTSLPLEQRMRGYLAANCSHCHNPTGERATRDFRWDTPLAQTMLCGADDEVVQGMPTASVIVQRISTRTNGMPPIATLQTDPIAIDVITRWIASEINCP